MHELLLDGKVLLRILICITVLITLFGSLTLAVIKKNSDIFANALGGIVSGLFLSYLLNVWSK